jgi:transposase
MGKRPTEQQPELFLSTAALPLAPGHPFYKKLNRLLAEGDFDQFCEGLCRPFFAQDLGRPSVPPGVYFRMLFVGYFEGLDSQRGIAWRCADSRSLQDFLGYLPTEPTPDHSSLSNNRVRLSEAVHEQVFAFVLSLAEHKGLLIGKSVGVDSTTLEANAALKSLRRRDTGDDYKAFLRKLAAEAGLEDPSDEELKRFDKNRKGKTLSNAEWVSPTDPEAKVAKMKDGTTHLAYKAEHVVDLKTELVLAAEVYHADAADSATLGHSVLTAELNLVRANSDAELKDVACDKGYHKVETIAQFTEAELKTYIPEAEQVYEHTWQDKPPEQERAYRNNRRRTQGAKGKRLQRLRSERVERSFAHVCETGGARRSRLRGLVEVSKRYLLQVAAHNLGVLMRRLFKVGTPRGLQGTAAAALACLALCRQWWRVLQHRWTSPWSAACA